MNPADKEKQPADSVFEPAGFLFYKKARNIAVFLRYFTPFYTLICLSAYLLICLSVVIFFINNNNFEKKVLTNPK